MGAKDFYSLCYPLGMRLLKDVKRQSFSERMLFNITSLCLQSKSAAIKMAASTHGVVPAKTNGFQQMDSTHTSLLSMV